MAENSIMNIMLKSASHYDHAEISLLNVYIIQYSDSCTF